MKSKTRLGAERVRMGVEKIYTISKISSKFNDGNNQHRDNYCFYFFLVMAALVFSLFDCNAENYVNINNILNSSGK